MTPLQTTESSAPLLFTLIIITLLIGITLILYLRRKREEEIPELPESEQDLPDKIGITEGEAYQRKYLLLFGPIMIAYVIGFFAFTQYVLIPLISDDPTQTPNLSAFLTIAFSSIMMIVIVFIIQQQMAFRQLASPKLGLIYNYIGINEEPKETSGWIDIGTPIDIPIREIIAILRSRRERAEQEKYYRQIESL